jgi:hypothetical protein
MNLYNVSGEIRKCYFSNPDVNGNFPGQRAMAAIECRKSDMEKRFSE